MLYHTSSVCVPTVLSSRHGVSAAGTAGRGRCTPARLQQWTQRPLRAANPELVTASTTTDEASTSSTWHYGHSLAQGPRDTMEDRVVLVENALGNCFLAGVFDGHGGSSAVEWVESEFYRILESVVTAGKGSNGKSTGDVQVTSKHLQQVFADVDKQLLQHLEGHDSQDHNSGATATVALLRDDWLMVANVGDCKAMLCRKAQPVVLTEDHRVYGFGPSVDAEIERVTAAGGWIVDGRVCNTLAVSRSFGDWEFKGEGLQLLLSQGAADGLWTQEFADEHKFTSDPVVSTPQVTEVELVPEDEFLVLASDGLWDFMPPLDVLRWTRRELKTGKTPDDVAESLCSLALKRYSADNVSVVVVDLKGREYWTAKPPKPKRSSMFGFLNKKKP